MKLLYLVIDGAAGELSEESALALARTPGLDELASRARCGLMYPIARGIAPESDAAVLSILGYNPEECYTGRGPLEALGAGIKLKEGYEVAFRANFATAKGERLELIDRRCGRDLETWEARELASALDGMELGIYDAYARVVATVGHRAVVVLGSRSYRLSGNVSNTDPAYERRGAISIARREYDMVVEECKPLDDTPEAARTAELANVFTRKAFQILDGHPINLNRERRGKLKANIVLLRDCGDKLPKVPSVEEKYGLRFAAIAEMPVEVGIARLLGMWVAEVPPPSRDKAKDYEERLENTLRLLEEYEAVYVHLKGPDEPAHDGDMERKIEAIELVDKHYVLGLLERCDLSSTAVIVTSDHATPCRLRAHSGDPVPVLVYVPGIEGDAVRRFCEVECAKGSLGTFEHGWELLPFVVEEMRRIAR